MHAIVTLRTIHIKLQANSDNLERELCVCHVIITTNNKKYQNCCVTVQSVKC